MVNFCFYFSESLSAPQSADLMGIHFYNIFLFLVFYRFWKKKAFMKKHYEIMIYSWQKYI